MELVYLLWLFAAALFAAIPIAFIKRFTLTNNYWWIVLAILSFIALTVCYIQLIRGRNITTVYPIIKILAIVLVSVFGAIFFGNKITTNHIIALLLAFAAIYLLASE